MVVTTTTPLSSSRPKSGGAFLRGKAQGWNGKQMQMSDGVVIPGRS